MDAATLDAVLKFVHAGGQSALVILVWVGSKISTRAHDALRTLERIEKALIADRAEQNSTQARQVAKLDAIHDDLQGLPLNILRATKR